MIDPGLVDPLDIHKNLVANTPKQESAMSHQYPHLCDLMMVYGLHAAESKTSASNGSAELNQAVPVWDTSVGRVLWLSEPEVLDHSNF